MARIDLPDAHEEGGRRRKTSREVARMPSSSSKIRRATPPARATLQLREVIERLRAVQSSVAVAVAALRAQNADIDEDVARLLVRSVSDPLQDQIDSIKSVLRQLPAPGPRKR